MRTNWKAKMLLADLERRTKRCSLRRIVRWLDDAMSVNDCKEILRRELDRDHDEADSLRTLTVVAANALHRERNKPANSAISEIKEAKMEELPEIIKTLKEMREACAACFRVISNNESMVLLLDAHLKEIGVEDGFGVRCQDLIYKLEQKGP